MTLLQWAEAHPELAVCLFMGAIAPFFAAFSRFLFSHSEPRPPLREEVTPELRQAMAEISASTRSNGRDIRKMRIELSLLRILLEGGEAPKALQWLIEEEPAEDE